MNKQKTYKLEIHHYLTPSAQFCSGALWPLPFFFFFGEPEVTTSG